MFNYSIILLVCQDISILFYRPINVLFKIWNRINNTDVIVNAMNKQKLCGASNWYLPPVDELNKLIFCSDSKYNVDGSDTNYMTC